jgi:hypothetical protein
MSFAVTKQGTYVLDQVNARVVLLSDGKIVRTLPVSRTTQDIAVAENGTIALLDRHGGKSVTLMDGAGRPIGNLPIEGPTLQQSGLATGVFVDGKSVYAEREHGALVRLGGLDGSRGEAQELSGRPSKDGTYLAAAWKAPDAARGFFYSAFDRAQNKLRFTRSRSVPVSSLVLLDTDRQGQLYVGVQGMDAEGVPKNVATVFCFSATSGELSGQASVRLSVLPEESFRDLVVTDDGEIVSQVRSESGVTFERTRCEHL